MTMKLTITIDTEEDDWGNFASSGQTLHNIAMIPRLQEIFDAFGVKPTYLITYPVATDAECICVLGAIEKSGRCEIGTHCHPWNTPPFVEGINDRNSMLCNLPSVLQYEKIHNLHETIVSNFGVVPTSFRSGRWGYDKDVAETLISRSGFFDGSSTPLQMLE
jgi:hypothetical protein